MSFEPLQAIALAFEGLDGVEAVVKWANKSPRNLTLFYTKIYTKLIPVSLLDGEQAETEDLNEARAGLERIFNGLIEAKRERDQASSVVAAEPG